jgi:tetratricopeptide (TPR) repeat protein
MLPPLPAVAPGGTVTWRPDGSPGSKALGARLPEQRPPLPQARVPGVSIPRAEERPGVPAVNNPPAAPAALPGSALTPAAMQLAAPPVGPYLPEPEGEPIPKLPTPLGKQETAQVQPGVEDAVLLGAARNAARQRNWDLATSRFEEYLRRFPDDLAVRKEYAGVLASAGRPRQAAEQYEMLVRKQPDSSALRVALADLHVQAKEYKRAIAQLQKALQLAPDNLDAATKLARAYLFDGNFRSALQVYDTYLAKLKPGDANVPRQFPALLLDLDWTSEALSFLLPLHEQKPEDVEVLANLVRAYARLGDRPRAAEMLEELGKRAGQEVGARLDLGETLYTSGLFEVAMLVYAQVLQVDPGNSLAQVGVARIHLQLFHPQQARAVLEGFTPGETARRSYLLTWAEYHQLVGEYVEAKRIYRDFLCQSETDHEARAALAYLYEYTREFEKAKAAYATIPASANQGRRARIGFAATLAAQRLFAEALDVGQMLITEDPSDGAAVGQQVRTLGQADQYDKAEALARAFLANYARNKPGSLTVRLALGKMLLDGGKCLEAAHEYELALAEPAGRLSAAYYGLARALARTGSTDKAQQVLLSVTAVGEEQTRNQLLLSDQFSADYDDVRAAEFAQNVLRHDPDNLAALIRLADAQVRLARFSGRSEEPAATSQHILALSPTNVRGHLSLARGLATGQNIKPAVAAYDHLIVLDPEFTVPRREKGRVLFSGREYGASEAAYRAAECPCADEQLQLELAAFAAKQPAVRPLLEPYLTLGAPGKVLRTEVGKLLPALPDEEPRVVLQRILNDYDARVADQTYFHLEGEAKSKKDFRNYEAVPVYQSLIAIEPGNTEALFDLGQVYGALKQNHNELPTYGQLLKVDPLHRDGMVATERSDLELMPQVRPYLDYFRQSGRDGLAHISRTFYGGTVRYPFGDENEFVSLGFSRALLVPPGAPPLPGNLFSLGGSKKFCDCRLLLDGVVNFEDFRNRLRDKPTFNVGGGYDVNDCLRVRNRLFLENVEENAESLRQNIFRLGTGLGADTRLTRYWTVNGDYRFAWYSDVNYFNELLVQSGLVLCEPPKQLKLVVLGDLYGYAHTTVFRSTVPDMLVGTIHPYFAPNSYFFYEARLEWTQWLSRDYFVHSNQCWYSLQYGIGWDSNFVMYNELRAQFNFDVYPWLTIGGQGQVLLSSAYNAGGAGVFAVIRCPWRCR